MIENSREPPYTWNCFANSCTHIDCTRYQIAAIRLIAIRLSVMFAYLHERWLTHERLCAVSNKLRRSDGRAFARNISFVVSPSDFRPGTCISTTQDVPLFTFISIISTQSGTLLLCRGANAIATILFLPRFLFLCFSF